MLHYRANKRKSHFFKNKQSMKKLNINKSQRKGQNLEHTSDEELLNQITIKTNNYWHGFLIKELSITAKFIYFGKL